VRYRVAASLDGFIAGPEGEADWIVHDPDIDFRELFQQFDTFLIGRSTYSAMLRAGKGSIPGKQLYVFSQTLRQVDHPDVTIVAENAGAVVRNLRGAAGADIWLFGGGSLFRSLVDARLVDTLEVAVIPILLGEGIPILSGPPARFGLNLTGHVVYPKTGIVLLEYEVQNPV
jgi:dihydrofolate reductase